MRSLFRAQGISLLVLLLLLSGCASYTAKPLSNTPSQLLSLKHLIAEVNTADNSTELSASAPLSLNEVAILAIKGNPDLKIKRKALGVVEAQTYSAGLFADPQFSANLDHPTSSLPGLTNAWGMGFGYDISSLLTHSATKTIAQKHQAKVRLELMWAEWQVILQARSLVVKAVMEKNRETLLSTVYARALKQYQLSTKSMADGNVTLEMNSGDLTSLLDVTSQLNLIKNQHITTLSDLNYLLGLLPNEVVPLADLPTLKPIAEDVIESKLKSIAQSRPDLLALQLGYLEQEERVRAAIWGQFPAFNVGITRASDTSSLHTSGFNIGLTLPLFSGNKGNIAIERATRAQLKEEYQARMSQTGIDIQRLMHLQNAVMSQQIELMKYLPSLDALLVNTRKAYKNRDVAALIYLNIESSWIKSQLGQMDLTQTQWETQIALGALLGGVEGSTFPQNILEDGDISK